MVEITKAPLAREPINLSRKVEIEWYELGYGLDPYPDQFKLNFFEKVNYWINNGAKYSKLVLTLIGILTKIGITMATSNDKKTTRTGLVKGIIATIVSVVMLFFSVDIPSELQSNLAALIVLAWGIIESVQGYFTNKPDDSE